jgi:hypothetical protein
MPLSPDRADKRKRYFRTLEDSAHILVGEDCPAVNCGVAAAMREAW